MIQNIKDAKFGWYEWSIQCSRRHLTLWNKRNRFQFMHDQYGFNPRKCNSASTLSNCIKREISCVIIALPTSNDVVDIFEQTMTGVFSSVNTRSAFDTEILL